MTQTADPSGREFYPAKLRDRDWWVNWVLAYRYEDIQDGDPADDAGAMKQPIAPYDGREAEPCQWNAGLSDEEYPATEFSEVIDWQGLEIGIDVTAPERVISDEIGVGIIIPTSNRREESVITLIDWDDVRDPETGEVHPTCAWALEQHDGYAEISQSGEGIHQLVLGEIPGDHRKYLRHIDEEPFVGDDRPMVEMYESGRLCAMTANHVDGTGDDIVEDQQLIDELCYRFRNNSNNSSPQPSHPFGRIDTDADTDTDNTVPATDDVADIIDSDIEYTGQDPNDWDTDHIRYAAAIRGRARKADGELPTVSNWKLIRFAALFGKQAGLTQQQIVTDLLDANSWDGAKRRCERHVASAWRAEESDRLGTPSVQLLKKKGLLPNECGNLQDKIDLDRTLKIYESNDSRELKRTTPHWTEIWTALGRLPADDIDDYAERLSNVCDRVTVELVKQHSRYYSHKEEHGSIIVEDGKTWHIGCLGEGNKYPLQSFELLNFELDVKSTLEVKRGPIRAQLQMQLQTGETYTKSIQPKVFNKKERFDDEILSESFGTQFSVPMTGDHMQDFLDELRMWIHHQDAPHRVGVSHLGLHDSELVIPDRTLAADGWTDTPDHVYLEREIGAERRVSLPDHSDPDTDAAAEIVETLPHTRDPERLLPVLGWFYSAPLRPTIESFSESGEFNHLSVTGDTGSGKTATLGYLWRCFGMSGEPFSVDSSSFAQLATYSSTNSIPLWFDEYKPSDISDYKMDRFHDLYRKATRGAFAERGNADKTTTSYKIQSPVCVSGEQAIQGPAERRRSVMTQFRTETTDAGTETAERFKQLIGQARMDDGEIEVGSDAADPANHALAYYRFICDADRAQLKERWYSALERAHRKLDDMGVTDELDDLEIQGVQTVIFGHDVMQWFAESVDANVDAIPDKDALHQAIEYMIGRIGPAGSRKSHVDRFIELFGRAAATDEYLERGTHYEITNEGQESEEIRINLPRSFDAISKYARDHGIDGVDLLNDASDYRDRFRELASTPGTYVVRTKQYTPGVSDCTGIRTVAVTDAVEFDRDVLETDFELSDSDDSTASDEHDDHDDASDGDSTDQPDYLSAGEISTAGLKSLEEIPSVRGTAAGIWEEYGNPRTELVGENGSIDIHFKGYDTPDVPLSPDGEYEIDGLRYEQDQDGHEYYELRNSPAVDIERLDDATDVDEPVPIERIPDIGTSTGYETVTVEVVSWDSPETDAIAHSGIAKDATGIIDVVAFDELSELSNYPEGRHYRFENVQIDEYGGDLQLILDPEITDWTEIQPGVGNLDHVSDESNQDLESATDGGSNTADTSDADSSTGSDDTASDDMASETAADADETDDTDDTDDYVEPDSDLSDADWKETLLMIIDANGNSIHPDALHEAVTDHTDKESDDAADLIRNAVDEHYLRTTVDMNWTSTSKLKGAVDAQTQDESG